MWPLAGKTVQQLSKTLYFIKNKFAKKYENLEKKFKVNEIYSGVVTKCVDYGCFIRLKNPKTNEPVSYTHLTLPTKA